jgi:molecular chaperone DnaK (HSP70)
LTKDEIDYVLFIGGSSKNPYVQAALKEHFKESELLDSERFANTRFCRSFNSFA